MYPSTWCDWCEREKESESASSGGRFFFWNWRRMRVAYGHAPSKKIIPAIFLKSIRRNDIKIPFHLHMNIFHIFFFLQNRKFALTNFFSAHTGITANTHWRRIVLLKFSLFLLWSGIIDNDLWSKARVFIASRYIKFLYSSNFIFFHPARD